MNILEIFAIILMFSCGFLFVARVISDPETTTEHLGEESIKMLYMYILSFFIALLFAIIR